MCEVRELSKEKKRVIVAFEDNIKGKSAWFEDYGFESEKEGRTSTENDNITMLLKLYNKTEEDISYWTIQRFHDKGIVYISEHAMRRLKERNGWNKKTSLRMIKKVFDNGKKAEDITGYLKPWIKKRLLRNENNIQGPIDIIMYGQDLYVFASNILVTTFHVPNKGFNYLTREELDLEF